jgi:hypothetical protein
MPFLSFIFSSMLVLAGLAAAELWDSHSAAKTSIQEVSAASVRIVATATARFIKDHPNQDGEVPPIQLDPYLPTWFNGDSRIRVAGKNGRGYIFIVQTNGNRTSTDQVITGSEMPVTLGIAMEGKLINPNAGTILFDVPDSIPNGSVVYVI